MEQTVDFRDGKMAMVTGGELAVRTLLQAGVEKIFALYGGHLETIFQGLREHQIPVLDVRHEVAAGYAAEGYARSTRKLGVALITAGPGFTNVLTSMANAYSDRTPVLYLCASAPSDSLESNTVQAGFDQVAVAKPMTKWAGHVTATHDIPRLLGHAIRVATSHPTGPVMLEIPMDVSYTPIEESKVWIPHTFVGDPQPLPRPEAIREALALLAAAKRPVIMAGPGLWRADAGTALRSFAAATGIPAFLDYDCYGLLPPDHPLYGGTFFKLLDFASGNNRPDVILALGVRTGVPTMGRSDKLMPRAAKIIHVETDPVEIGRLRDVTLPIVADSRETLQALNEQRANFRWPDFKSWQSEVQRAKDARPQRFAEIVERRRPPIHPYQAGLAVVESAPPNAIFVGDGAEANHWLIEALQAGSGGMLLSHGLFACLGSGTGTAMGAQIAHPDKRVICVTGDGGVGFTIAEFDTMVRHNLPIVVVVLNNRSWGATRHWQDMVSGPNKNIATDLGAARYEKVAMGFGCHGEYVSEILELKPALERALRSGKPACVNVEIELAAMPPESEALGAAGHD